MASATARQLPGHQFVGVFTMGQQANTGKSTKQQPAGKGQPQPKKGK